MNLVRSFLRQDDILTPYQKWRYEVFCYYARTDSPISRWGDPSDYYRARPLDWSRFQANSNQSGWRPFP